MTVVSVIIPAYNEDSNLTALYARLCDVTSEMGNCQFEFLFVDDGSTDSTLFTLARLRQHDGRIKVIRFSRNFGSHAACLAGLTEAKGDLICFLAADLQDPPELIPRMLAKSNEGYDVVFAVRSARQDSWLTVKSAHLYHRLMRRYAIPTWPIQGADVFMLTAAVRDVIVRWRQKNTSIFAQILWAGFRQASIPYVKQERYSGHSKWILANKVKLVVDSLVSFSFAPIRWISGAGLLFAGIGLSYGAFTFFYRLYNGTPLSGWTPLLIVLLIVCGIQLLALGVLGEYLWRAAEEVRGAPPFVIQFRLGRDSAAAADSERFQRPESIQPVDDFRILSLGGQRTR